MVWFTGTPASLGIVFSLTTEESGGVGKELLSCNLENEKGVIIFLPQVIDKFDPASFVELAR